MKNLVMLMSLAWLVAGVCWAGCGVALGQSAPAVESRAESAAAIIGQDPYAPADPGLEAFISRLNTDDGYVGRFYDQYWSPLAMDKRAALYDGFEARLRAMDFGKLSLQGQIDYVLARHWMEAQRADITLRRARLKEMEAVLPFREAVQGLEERRRQMERVEPREAAEVIAKIPEMVKAAREGIERGRKKEEGGEKREGSGEKKKEGEGTGGTPVPPRGEEMRPSRREGPPSEAAPSEAAPGEGRAAEKNEAITLTPVVALRAAGAVDELHRVMSDFTGYEMGYKPEATWWLRQPADAADKALNDYAKYLREEIAGVKGEAEDPLVGDPIGAEALASALKVEMIPYSPEELVAIAEREFAWCEGEMRKASAEMGLKDDWKAALAKVKQASAAPGTQDELVRDQARAAIEFLKKNDLVTVPEAVEEMWRVEMLSPQAQRTLPFAVYGGQYMGVAYPTDAMTTDDKLMSMRGNNKHFTHNVTPHELVPGHHLQGYFERRARAYRQMFSTPFLVEGWALYWEMELYERGWQKTPEDRIGALFWRMHRCARIIVSLKFHLGQMTPDEMVGFLVERVGHEKFGATSEVRRFIGGDYSPLYQCGYMVGGLQLRALGREVVGDEPPGEIEGPGDGAGAKRAQPRMTRKQFNDAVLQCGPIPIELVRASIVGQSPEKGGEAVWRFAGSPLSR